MANHDESEEMKSEQESCPTCQRPLGSNGECLRCAMSGAIEALQTAEADPATADETAYRVERLRSTRSASVHSQGEESPTKGFAAFAPLELPAKLGHFIVKRKIASGGMGTVYEAEDTRLRRQVALKMIKAFAFSTTEEKARFHAEANAAAALDHPNIVPIYEVGQVAGQPYFTMKLIEGSTLSTRLKSGPLAPREAAELLEKVARAVAHAHSRGVLHRDLKPGNILLDSSGEPWLTDFGLAKLGDQEGSMTITIAQLGTPHYMSPEQAMGRTRDISTASDVWALGVMLFQMLSGRLPFVGQSSGEVLKQVMDADAAQLLRFRSGTRLTGGTTQASGSFRNFTEDQLKQSVTSPEVATPASKPDPIVIDRDLGTLITRCLEKDPVQRLHGAEFLAEELQRWLDRQPLRSRPVTATERLWKWTQRHPWAVASIFSLLLSWGIGSAVGWVQWQRAEAAATEARATRDAAEEDSAFATLGNALTARERFDFSSARRLLASIDSKHRDFEWRLLAGLNRGDDMWSVACPTGPLALYPPDQGLILLSPDRKLLRIQPVDGKIIEDPTLGSVPLTSNSSKSNLKGFRHLSFAPDGKHYAVAEGNLLIVASTGSKEVLYTTSTSDMELAWIDSDRLLYGKSARFAAPMNSEGKREAVAWVYQLSTKEKTLLPVESSGTFAVSPDHQHVAWVLGNHRVALRKVADGLDSDPLMVQRLPGNVIDLEFSDSGKLAASWDKGALGGVVVYDIAKREAIFERPMVPRTALAFSPSFPDLPPRPADTPDFEPTDLRAGRLVAANIDPWLTVWDFHRPAKHIGVYDDCNQGMGDVLDQSSALRPPRRLLTRSVEDERGGFLFGHESRVQRPLMIPGETSFITSSSDGTVRRWPLRSKVLSHQLCNFVDTAHAFFHPTASPNGRYVIYRHVRRERSMLWDREQDIEIKFPAGETGLAAFDDGRVLLRGDESGEIRCVSDMQKFTSLWSTNGGPSIQGFHQLNHSTVSEDGRIVACLQPGRLLVIDTVAHTAQGTGDLRMNLGIRGCQCVALSPDAHKLAVTGIGNGQIAIYQTKDITQKPLLLSGADAQRGHDTCCVFSRDGQRLYVGSSDGSVRVYNAQTNQELPEEGWKAHTSDVTSLALSMKGNIIATSSDGSTIFWSTDLVPGKGRRRRLEISLADARNWLHFGGTKAKPDTVFLHSAPNRPLEGWETVPE